MLTNEDLDKRFNCAPLLPDGGCEAVRELVTECRRLNQRIVDLENIAGKAPVQIYEYASQENERLRKQMEELKAEKRAVDDICVRVNEAINRAGIHCALYYWDAIDQLAKERDDARKIIEHLNEAMRKLLEYRVAVMERR